jgi:hypothetical protein
MEVSININKNVKLRAALTPFFVGAVAMYTHPMIGIPILAIWLTAVLVWFATKSLWFIGMASFSEQYFIFKALCEEKKRKEEFENSLLLQKIEELNSLVSNAASSHNTSS